MSGYDEWLLKQADEYYSVCEPEIISAEEVYEGTLDGRVEYSMDYKYNCEGCEHEDCEYWKEHN